MVAEATGATHEFKGSEDEFWNHPRVHSNSIQEWMLDPKITRLCLWRENAIEGAISLMLMSYRFPDRSFRLPRHEVQRIARFRRDREAEMQAASDWSFSYESLCDGNEIDHLPDWFRSKFGDLIGDPGEMRITSKKVVKANPINAEELWQSE